MKREKKCFQASPNVFRRAFIVAVKREMKRLCDDDEIYDFLRERERLGSVESSAFEHRK